MTMTQLQTDNIEEYKERQKYFWKLKAMRHSQTHAFGIQNITGTEIKV